MENKLNKVPDASKLKINKQAKNSQYLPIGDVEIQLDEVFGALMWQTENFRFDTILNELVGSIDLLVFNQEFKIWIRRTGAAAVPIMMKSGSKATQVENKIINTLTKDYPHLLSACITSAARSLGRYFGRGLNRDTVYEDDVKTENEGLKKAFELFSTAQSNEELKAQYATLDSALKSSEKLRKEYVKFNNRFKK